ncbi:MAG: hypothetical protein MIO87_05550 [Methanomassiliicoccales archaeon]|nr:hypothetical protein [Methanomassiliicoccales archaeon]
MEGMNRPLGVTIIGILLFILGLFWILGGTAVVTLTGLETLELAVGTVSVLVGLLYIVLAFGFFKGWGWIWILTMVVQILGILWSVAQWVIDGADMGQVLGLLIGMIIPIIIVLYMNSRDVKLFFGRA